MAEAFAGKAKVQGSRPRAAAREVRESPRGETDPAGLQTVAGNRAVGHALDASVRSSMEGLFGTSFADVRVHADASAQRSADAVGASAYTVGRDVVFGPGQLDTRTREGRMLIAHELAHVVQQRNSAVCGAAGDGAAEAEADRAAEHIGVGRAVSIGERRPVGMARAEKGYLERLRDLSGSAQAKAEEIKTKALARVREAEDLARAAAREAEEKARAFARAAEEKARTAVDAVGGQAREAQAVANNAAAQANAAQANVSAKVKKALPALKKQGTTLARDAAKGYVGTVEGVWLEAANIADTGLWAVGKVGDAEDMVFGGLDDAAKSAGLGPTSRTALTTAARGATFVVSMGTFGAAGPATKALRDAANASPIDPVTGKPLAIDPITGAPMVSGLVTKVFDKVENVVDDSGVFSGAAKSDDLLTMREKGQIAGSVGSQTGLALVGAEEVTLALKVVGAVGAARSIEIAARKNATKADPTAFVKAPEFWIAVGNMVLFIIGLRAASSGRKLLQLFVDAAMLGLATVPPVIKYAHDLQNANGPDREAVLHEDLKQVARAGVEVMRQIVMMHMGGAKPGAKGSKAPGEPEPHAGPAAKAAPEGAAAPEPATPAKPTVIVKVSEDGHAPATASSSGKPQPATPAAPVKEPLPEPGQGPYRRNEPPPPEPTVFPQYEKPAQPAPAPPVAPPPQPVAPPQPTAPPPVPRRRIDPSPFKEPAEAPPQRPGIEIHPRFKKPVPPAKTSGEAPPSEHAAPAPVGIGDVRNNPHVALDGKAANDVPPKLTAIKGGGTETPETPAASQRSARPANDTSTETASVAPQKESLQQGNGGWVEVEVGSNQTVASGGRRGGTSTPVLEPGPRGSSGTREAPANDRVARRGSSGRPTPESSESPPARGSSSEAQPSGSSSARRSLKDVPREQRAGVAAMRKEAQVEANAIRASGVRNADGLPPGWDYGKHPHGPTRRWTPGDPVNMPDGAGNYPAWGTIRKRIWRTKANDELAARKAGVSDSARRAAPLDPIGELTTAELQGVAKSGTMPKRVGAEIEHKRIPQRMGRLLEKVGLEPSEARDLTKLGDPSNLDPTHKEWHAVVDEMAKQRNPERNPSLKASLDDREQFPLGSATNKEIGEITDRLKQRGINLNATKEGGELKQILLEEKARRRASATWTVD